MSDNLRKQKQMLRKDIRSKLAALTLDEIQQQSRMVWERLKELKVYQEAKSVGLFLSMPKGEIDTDVAIADAVASNKAIFVPQVGKNFEKADMELFCVRNTKSALDGQLFHHSWPRNKWNIPEPPPDLLLEAARPGDIDVLIVPGLGFDRQGNRLGQGKGYYDRFIARMSSERQHPSPILVAAALECQLIEPPTQIPVQEYDAPVDWILTPRETIQLEKFSTIQLD